MGSAAVVAAAMTAIGTSGAEAAQGWPYCDRQVPAHTACDQVAYGTTIFLNWARYPGVGTVRVCERVITVEGQSTISRRCRNTFVDSDTDLTAYPRAYKMATVGNDSDWQHLINGMVLTP